MEGMRFSRVRNAMAEHSTILETYSGRVPEQRSSTSGPLSGSGHHSTCRYLKDHTGLDLADSHDIYTAPRHIHDRAPGDTRRNFCDLRVLHRLLYQCQPNRGVFGYSCVCCRATRACGKYHRTVCKRLKRFGRKHRDTMWKVVLDGGDTDRRYLEWYRACQIAGSA